MSNVVHRPMTRVREELRPSPPLKAALNGFLEHPTNTISLYTQAERIVSTDDFRGKEYQEYVRAAESRLKKLGRKSFAIASEVGIQTDDAGITLFFDPAQSGRATLLEMTSALDEIEWEGTTVSGLYVRLARSALAKDIKRQNAAARALTMQLRHASAEHQMHIGDPRIVSRDVVLRS